MAEQIHYVDVSIRIKFDPIQLHKMLAAGRKLTQENIQVSVDDDDPENDLTRSMTDDEVAEDISSVQGCVAEILYANPLLDELGLEIIASAVAEERMAV